MTPHASCSHFSCSQSMANCARQRDIAILSQQQTSDHCWSIIPEFMVHTHIIALNINESIADIGGF